MHLLLTVPTSSECSSARAIKSDALAHRSCSNMYGSNDMKKGKKNPTTSNTEKSQVSRRNFVKGAATLAAAAAAVPLKPLLGGPGATADAPTIPYQSNQRTNDSYLYRRRVA